MNTKKFIAGGFIGGLVDFMLGWLFYGILFKNVYPAGEDQNLTFIFLGCLVYAFFISYIFNKWASISTFNSGAIAGAIIGLFYSLSMNLYMFSNQPFNLTNFLLDIGITIVMSSIVGGVIGLINGKLK